METTKQTPQCEQGHMADADGYWIDPIPGGWGGWYCYPCGMALEFQLVDKLEKR